VAPGHFEMELGHTVAAGRPAIVFPLIRMAFQYSKTFQLVNYEKVTSGAPKISKLSTGLDLNKMNNFTNWPNSILPLYFMLSILEQFPF
jgi:hypothetical protein